MKSHLILSVLLTSALSLGACTQPQPAKEKPLVVQEQPVSRQTSSAIQGEKAIPTVKGDLIKVNNKLCAVSRGPMDEKTLGTFKGQVAYEGSNPKFQGKTFEFNYCCGMCQKSFPDKFKMNPDEILYFHGLL